MVKAASTAAMVAWTPEITKQVHTPTIPRNAKKNMDLTPILFPRYIIASIRSPIDKYVKLMSEV